MNLDRLRPLAESLHFRKTADRLHLSQSVSQQISALERVRTCMRIAALARGGSSR